MNRIGVAMRNFAAILLFAATGIVSICGWVWYNAYSDKKNGFK
jgi:hypothetical protein